MFFGIEAGREVARELNVRRDLEFDDAMRKEKVKPMKISKGFS